MATDRRAPFALAASVLGISVAAPLIRLSASGPLVIATWRLVLANLVIAGILLVTGSWREWRMLRRREVGIGVAAGALLALHFWSWNASLAYTSVMASVVLVNLQPVIVALLSGRWLGEAPSRRQWVGVGIAMAGALLVAAGDAGSPAPASGTSARALLGDLLALIGGVTAALYYLAGRRLRQRVGVWPYVGLVYGACLGTMLCLVAATRASLWPQPPREWAIYAGLALGPMLLGHTGMNWALGHLPAFVVNLTVLGEPLGATLLAFVLPWIHETPAPATLVGGAVVLAGVVLTAREARG
jgi:drug/metabolite transporter (DMT)-like permease